MDFGRVLGGVWEAKILNFRTFFDVFSMSFFKRASEGEKIDQKYEKTKLFRFLASGLRWSPGRWGKERIGEKTLLVELRERMSRLASCDWTEPISLAFSTPLAHLRWKFLLKTPRGGTPPATPLREHLAHRRQDTEAQAFEADVL